jgi:hypothetical protein
METQAQIFSRFKRSKPTGQTVANKNSAIAGLTPAMKKAAHEFCAASRKTLSKLN